MAAWPRLPALGSLRHQRARATPLARRRRNGFRVLQRDASAPFLSCYARGLFTEDGKYIYVNVGVGTPIRLVRPEISLFSLHRGDLGQGFGRRPSAWQSGFALLTFIQTFRIIANARARGLRVVAFRS